MTDARAIASSLKAAKAAFDATADESVERLLADAIGSLRLALDLATKRAAASYLEYRPVGAGHDADPMPF